MVCGIIMCLLFNSIGTRVIDLLHKTSSLAAAPTPFFFSAAASLSLSWLVRAWWYG